jgi:UDP-N-acetylglucosamine 2-epimerase (non-hydrolysing)
MEAGNRCFDMRVPEEINRRIVDHTADINMPYSNIAREYLLAEGIHPDRVIKTGSPMFEVLNYYRPKIDESVVQSRLGVTENEYFLVSAHREENVDSKIQLGRLHETLNAIAARYDLPVLVSTHPRTRAQIERRGLEFDSRVQLLKPFGFVDYNALQKKARCVLSDSGTISEESSILGFPALNIREAHERPEAMEEAAVMLSGLEVERVMQSLDVLTQQMLTKNYLVRPVSDYSIPNVSQKVVRIIMSYTNYVHNVVWKAQ